MATTEGPRSQGVRRKSRASRPSVDGRYRFTVDQFYRLDELGFFEGRRVELIVGILHEMTIKPAHALASELVFSILQVAFGPGWRIRAALPLDLGRRSLPEPDFAVVAGNARDGGLVHPSTAALAIEISHATLRKDRTLKAHLYARAGIPDYWILNLVDRRLEVHRGPGPDPARRGRFRYTEVTTVDGSGRMAPLAAPGSFIAVADVLP